MISEEVIICPNCENVNINETKVKSFDQDVTVFTCVICGYYTQDDFTLLNKTKMEQYLPRLYRDLCKMSKDTDLSWYPSVMNIKNLVILFPDGTDINNWSWCVAPFETIPKEERAKYPIAEKKNEYETHRVSLKHSKHFDKNNFISAMTYLNFILKDVN